MRIGILTFHWATNYGAVLQAFALQKRIQDMGHEVYIIDYKPWNHDVNFYSLFRYGKILHPIKLLKECRKEKLISSFRQRYLVQTERIKRSKDLHFLSDRFDCIISGSDQVMNASFLRVGEPGGSTAYYIGFGRKELKRIAYAVSFGTTKFPTELFSVTCPLISRFSSLSVREQSGASILNEMGRKDSVVVPDPTLLLTAEHYKLMIDIEPVHSEVCYYILHGRKELVKKLHSHYHTQKLTENNNCSVEDWLANIRGASCFITNSFHGCVFSILFHVPFMIVLRTLENKGMNDRFFSLLQFLGLTDRITTEDKLDYSILTAPINWEEVDRRLQVFRGTGFAFINDAIKE